jgi:hypothetical protein
MKKINLLTACVFALFVLNANAMEKTDTGSNKPENYNPIAAALNGLKDSFNAAFNRPAQAAKPWYSKAGDIVKTSATDSVKDCVKDTVKETYKTAILNPFIINPIKNLFVTKSEKIKKDTAEIVTLSEQIKKLKDSGANRKYIAFLQAQLKKKIQDSSNNAPKK